MPFPWYFMQQKIKKGKSIKEGPQTALWKHIWRGWKNAVVVESCLHIYKLNVSQDSTSYMFPLFYYSDIQSSKHFIPCKINQIWNKIKTPSNLFKQAVNASMENYDHCQSWCNIYLQPSNTIIQNTCRNKKSTKS